MVNGKKIKTLKQKEQAIPDGFTLFSAASNEQISRPLEEAKTWYVLILLNEGYGR